MQRVLRRPLSTYQRATGEVHFGANYRELARDPMRYGYDQFRFVLDAARAREGLDLTERMPARAP